MLDAVHCGTDSEHQVSNGSLIGLFSLLILSPFKRILELRTKSGFSLLKFWSRRLGFKRRRLDNRVPVTPSSISWNSRRLNTRSSWFLSQPPAIDENPDKIITIFAQRRQIYACHSRLGAPFLSQDALPITKETETLDACIVVKTTLT